VEWRRAGGRTGTTPPGQLTPQEARWPAWPRAGKTNREIAGQLYLTVNTVETHLRHVYQKLGIHRRVELLTLPDPRRRQSAAQRRRDTGSLPALAALQLLLIPPAPGQPHLKHPGGLLACPDLPVTAYCPARRASVLPRVSQRPALVAGSGGSASRYGDADGTGRSGPRTARATEEKPPQQPSRASAN